MGMQAIDVFDRQGLVCTLYGECYDCYNKGLRIFNDNWNRKVIAEYHFKEGEWYVTRPATENEEVIQKVLTWDKAHLNTLANTIRVLE